MLVNWWDCLLFLCSVLILFVSRVARSVGWFSYWSIRFASFVFVLLLPSPLLVVVATLGRK